ncbi:hypothetical protein ACWCQK_11010 [Streptomyces sp. NPDC002306]
MRLRTAAAAVLAGIEHTSRAYDFTGHRWTFADLADAVGRVSGRPVEVAERGERAAGARGRLEEEVRAGAPERQTGDLRKMLGRPPRSLSTAVAEVLAPTRGA